MTSFWSSIDKLSYEGFKVAWFGIFISLLGFFFPDYKWLSLFGLGGTIIGLILRHRAEFLKKIEAAPRLVTAEQKAVILSNLKNVPKQPIAIQFFGQDLEAKGFAAQIKQLLEAADFPVGNLQGFMTFEISFGLSVVIYNSDSNNLTALGIQKALASGGLDLKMEVNSNKMTPTVQISVHSKPLK